MDRVEILRRLGDGEDPVTLSIEHWEENRELVVYSGKLPPLSVTGDECALCAWVDVNDMDCDSCLLTQVSGMSCNELDSPWKRVINARSRNNSEALLRAVDDMLEMLRVIESLTTEERLTCRHEGENDE